MLKARAESATAAGELEVAQGAVTEIENSVLYKIAVQQDAYDNAETEQKKEIAKAALAKLGFENYLESLPGYVQGSYTGLSWYAKDIDENDFYRAFYKVINENDEEVIVEAYVEYSVSETADGNFSEASYKLVHSEKRTTDPTSATPDKWKTADGTEFAESDTIKFVKTEDEDEYIVDLETGVALVPGDPRDAEIPEGATEVEGSEKTTYALGEYWTREYEQIETVINWHSTNGKNAGKDANGYINQLRYYGYDVVVTVHYRNNKGKAQTAQITIKADDSFNDIQSMVTAYGKVSEYDVGYVSYSQGDPIYETAIIETVTKDYSVTSTTVVFDSSEYGWDHYDTWNYYDACNLVNYLNSIDNEYNYILKSYVSLHGNIHYYYIKTKTETTTKTVIVSLTAYDENNKCVEKIPGTPEIPGSPYTVYVSDENSVHSVSTSDTAKAKSAYEEKTGTLTEKTTASENAAAKVTEIEGTEEAQGILGKVVSAVKEVLKLTSVSGIANSQLTTIEGIVNTADANYNAAVAKKAANDAAAAAASAATTTTGGGATTTTGGGAPVVYPSATVAAATEEVDETVIPDDAVPAAGQTRTTRTRRTAANNAVAEEETTTIDEAETPLAGGDADDAVVEDTEDTTTVEEDLVPLAGETQKGFFARTWWGWLLLIIAVLTGTTAYAKKKADAKKIK